VNYLDTIKDKRTAQSDKDDLQKSMQELSRVLSVSNSQAPKDFSSKVDELSKSILLAFKELKNDTLNSDKIDVLKQEYKNLASNIIKANDEQYKATQKSLKDVLSTFKASELSPTVNVSAPIVNVPENDFSALEIAIRDLKEDEDIDLDSYKAHDIKDVEDVQYIGFIHPSGAWYIVENQVESGKLRYLFGTSKYATHFRSAPTYKYQTIDKAYKAQ
jgi:hypothetical protein